VRICNRPGRNHPALVAGTRASGVNNLYKHAKEDLVAMGIGNESSTFQGLEDMRHTASAFKPPATVSLLVHADHVAFEFSCELGVPTPNGSPEVGSPEKPSAAAARGTSTIGTGGSGSGGAGTGGQPPSPSPLMPSLVGTHGSGPQLLRRRGSADAAGGFQVQVGGNAAADGTLPSLAPSGFPLNSRGRRADASTLSTDGLLPEGLIFIVADDDEIPRMGSEALIELAKGHALLSTVLGESRYEVDGLPKFVAKLAESQGHKNIVCLIDQNLDYGAASIKGTDLCRALREVHRFGGLIFIQSADDDVAHENLYIAAGADACLGKGSGSMAAKLRKMSLIYHAKFSGPPTCRGDLPSVRAGICSASVAIG